MDMLELALSSKTKRVKKLTKKDIEGIERHRRTLFRSIFEKHKKEIIQKTNLQIIGETSKGMSSIGLEQAYRLNKVGEKEK